VLGRVPEGPGDRVVVGGRTIEVLAVDGRAITEVRVGPAPATAAGHNGDERGVPSPAR
jgi:putative hemolysin